MREFKTVRRKSGILVIYDLVNLVALPDLYKMYPETNHCVCACVKFNSGYITSLFEVCNILINLICLLF